MKTSFLAITLAALFVTAGFAQTEQESVSDTPAPAVTTTEAATPAATPAEVAPIMAAPMMESPMMPMSSCCGCASTVPTYMPMTVSTPVTMPMTSYVMPVTYQQPIVQQAATSVAQTAQTIAQPMAQTIAQPMAYQQGYTQPMYYGTGYTQQYNQGGFFQRRNNNNNNNNNCGCSGSQSVLATPISTPIVTGAAQMQQPMTTVSTPIATPTTPIATQPITTQPITTQPIAENVQPVVQPYATQSFTNQQFTTTQPFVTQPVSTGQTFGTSTLSGGNYWQPQSVYSNECCGNNSGGRFFNGRILRRR